jgi:hypothetical protein
MMSDGVSKLAMREQLYLSTLGQDRRYTQLMITMTVAYKYALEISQDVPCVARLGWVYAEQASHLPPGSLSSIEKNASLPRNMNVCAGNYK